jgi:hypothetical protein
MYLLPARGSAQTEAVLGVEQKSKVKTMDQLILTLLKIYIGFSMDYYQCTTHSLTELNNAGPSST